MRSTSALRRVFLAVPLTVALGGCGSKNEAPTVPAAAEPGPTESTNAPDAQSPLTRTGPDAGPSGGPTDASKPVVGLTTPPPLPAYSNGTCPTLVGGPTEATSLNTDFSTGSDKRNFHVIVPPSYDGTSPWPVVFAWHWLNAGPGSFISAGELESATEQMHFIAVVPDHKRTDKGDKVYQFDWPFVELWGVDSELKFIDDMLACVNAKYKVDPTKIYGVGVSAGGLWMTYVSTTDRANHFAAIESLSGGLAAEPFGFWQMKFVPQPKKFPAIVLWGGPTDNLGIDFAAASKRYRDALRGDHHFVVECTHNAGHAMPPVPPPPNGGTHFEMLWQFMLDHPYGTPPDQSPYQTAGLPSSFPSWCSIAP